MLLDKGITFAYIVNKVKFDILLVLAIGLLTNLITLFASRYLPQMPLAIPALLGTAISILLSFKMNPSYDRWWEARKVWGAIVNDSRTLVIQLQTLLDQPQASLIQPLAYRQVAWCYCLGQSLRGLNPLEGCDGLLSAADLSELATHSN